jgi:uncharacterized protein YkwD
VEAVHLRFIVIHSFIRTACFGLSVVLALGCAASAVVARETYVQFADRLLTERPEGTEVRVDLEAAVLRATNSYRASKRYPALKKADQKLLIAARAHAMDLLASSAMGHTSSTGYGFESRVRAFYEGQMILAPMAENAARLRNSTLSDSERAQALVQQWIKSAGHRKNMINRTYTTVAIGVVSRGDDVYAVQIFSGPQVKTNMFGGSTN